MVSRKLSSEKYKVAPRGASRVASVSVAILTAGAIFLQASPAFSIICPSPAEQTALQVRVLQTKLMVSALSCNTKSAYNSFVQRFHHELVPHGKTLRSLFSRAYGKKGRYHMNKFITRLANHESALRISTVGRYCPSAKALFTQVLSTNNGYVAALARTLPFKDSHGITSCQARPNDFRAAQREQ